MKYRKMLSVGLTAGLLLGAGASHALAGPVINLPNDMGWLRINYEMQLYGQWRDTGSGADRTDDTTDIYFRRNRLSLTGMHEDRFGFYAAMEHTGNRQIFPLDVLESSTSSDFDILDAYFIANFNEAANLRAGLLKDPLVRAHNTGCFFPLALDRSDFVYTSIPRRSRDYGVLLWGNLLEQRFQYKLAATTGIKDNAPGNDLRYTARAHYSFWDPEGLPLYFGTYFGNKKVLTVGAGYQVEKDAVYGNLNLQAIPNDYSAWTVDIFGELPTGLGTFTMEAAYLDSSFDDNYQGGDPSSASIGIDGEKNGYYGQGGYLLPGKVGPGQLQFYGRYENWNFANIQGIVDQEIDRLSIGANYYLRGNNLRLTMEWADTDFSTENITIKDFSTITAMLQFLF